jgi:hypothetical protein
MSRTGTGTPTSQSNAQPIFPLAECLEFVRLIHGYFGGEHEFALCHLIASATGSLQRPEARDGQDSQCEASLGTRPLSINPRNGCEGMGDGDHHRKTAQVQACVLRGLDCDGLDGGGDGLV